ncbi:polyphenol oxidase family protein [Citricoccus sp. NPDC055426]|uniref:polyphenol oxidase family protein n=1 Tax=Citricoccus sp. NPDC055426 TaxID=3155536 RepID=UPI00341E19DA
MLHPPGQSPFLWRTEPGDGLHVAFTGIDAGNLAFHVSGGGSGEAAAGPPSGPAAAAAARHRLEDAMGVRRGSTEYLTQVHSARVVPSLGRGWGTETAPREADALVSGTGRDPLAIMVADCLPVVLVSRPAGQQEYAGPTAVAHAGRQGLLDGVLQSTVARLRQDGAGDGPGDLHAWIGPGICGRCYEVPASMRADGVARIPATGSTTSWGTPALDLPAGAEAVLTGLGVTVHRSAVCTLEDHRVFSHRRAPGRGRFVGLVWRTP